MMLQVAKELQLGISVITVRDDEHDSSHTITNYTCALLNSGSLKCWGENTTGQLGLATTQSPVYLSPSLPSVSTGIQVSEISSSADTTCALSASGEAKCWGSNDLGQLGIGSLAVIGDDEHPSSISVISIGQNLSSISAGNKHVCGTTTTGNLFCWGYGEGGRLGYGNATSIGDDELPSSVGPVPGATIGGGEEPPASIAYDEQDRLLRFGTKTFTYNGNGDLLTETDTSTGSTKTFDYDVFGNLKSVILPNKTISYKVDAHNRRVTKLENGAVVEYYLWNARNQIIGKADPNGLLLARYVYGSKAHVPDYIITDSSEFHIVTDHLGSPVVIVDSNSGTVVQEVKYDEFGIVLSDSNPGFTPFGFAGCFFDQDTKLCRFGARDYDASIGRWLSKDPILFAGGDTNLYGYVLQDPINWIDSDGLSPNRPGMSPADDVLTKPGGGYNIGGITGYTRHGLNSAISRNGVGVSPQSILNTVRNPISTQLQPNGTTRYTGSNSVVVLNPQGQIVTTWPTNSSGQRCGE